MIMPNPFTPKSGLEPRVFTGRSKEIHGKITTKRISYESVGTLVSRLKEKGLVKRVSRGKYIVADKLLREYIISMDE